MNPLVFITGYLGTDDSAFVSLSAYIKKYYSDRINGLTNIIVCRYTDDVSRIIKISILTNTPLVLAGHSFGGARAVEIANELLPTRLVDHLILLDPVSYTPLYTAPDTVNFNLPNNVVEAICYYRVATAAPWSAPIKSASGRFANFQRVMDHSDSVWTGETLTMVGKAVNNQPMVPVVTPVVPTPIVKSPVVSFVVKREDGTSQEFKV